LIQVTVMSTELSNASSTSASASDPRLAPPDTEADLANRSGLFSPALPTPPARGRLASIDAYRGFVMFLMMAEVLHLCAVSNALPPSDLWQFLCHNQEHVEWTGCTLHDMIQPSFSFLVGVALPFSIASRLARGQSMLVLTAHALWRSILLVFLGVFLRSRSHSQTYFTFEDTLSQIGLGYTFLFLLGFRPRRDQWIALVLILVGYWAAFALYPVPKDPAFYRTVGVPESWPHLATGFEAHWNKNSNAAWAFDTWFLNLFPREQPFAFNGGGYSTLSFIPTLATMILGLLAGGVIRGESAADLKNRKIGPVETEPQADTERTLPRNRSFGGKLTWLIVAGLVSLALGWGLGELGVCPIVKRIWTPSWVLYSGGWCFLMMAGFFAIVDGLGLKALFYPLRVIGMNSIAAYCMSGLIEGFIGRSLTIHLGDDIFKSFGPAYEPLVHGAAVLLVLWLILAWMDRRKIYLRI
jgi:predicted acyltransferase